MVEKGVFISCKVANSKNAFALFSPGQEEVYIGEPAWMQGAMNAGTLFSCYDHL